MNTRQFFSSFRWPYIIVTLWCLLTIIGTYSLLSRESSDPQLFKYSFRYLAMAFVYLLTSAASLYAVVNKKTDNIFYYICALGFMSILAAVIFFSVVGASFRIKALAFEVKTKWELEMFFVFPVQLLIGIGFVAF